MNSQLSLSAQECRAPDTFPQGVWELCRSLCSLNIPLQASSSSGSSGTPQPSKVQEFLVRVRPSKFHVLRPGSERKE